MATIKDVAKRANVSICTVSNVINKKNKVKPETMERILEAIEEYDFRPKSAARCLKTKQTQMIGIILPNISNLFFTEITRGIEDAANKHGYQVILCNTDDDPQKEIDYLNSLYSKDIDGIIFLGTSSNQKTIYNKHETPIVFINGLNEEKLTSVAIDDIQGGYLAAKHLLEKKDSNIIYLSGPCSKKAVVDRMTGCKKALELYGNGKNVLVVHQCEMNFQSGYDTVKELIKNNTEIKSIFAACDTIAIGAMRALIENGFKVPDDVSVVGHDDISIAAMFVPSLTTIRQPKYLMGQTAVELLINKINDRSTKNECIVVEPELIIREST